MNRIVDLLILLILLPLVLPFVMVVMLSAFILHKNNIFFVQERVGKNESVFKLYKMRSMIIGAQKIGTGLYSYANDNRITPLGNFLRKTSLDELPQLFNILKGDMSFIGPRPAVVGELDAEEGLPDNATDRFKVRPGLTGWAQIHGRDNLTWLEKIKYDLEYVHASPSKRFGMNVYVFFYTPLYLLNFRATYEKKKDGEAA